MRTTLGQAKASIDISEATGIASCDTTRFVGLLNSAQGKLGDLGRWWGTYQRLYVCMSQGCITWPAGVANVDAFRICDQGIQILNLWYEFQNEVCQPSADECACASRLMLDRPTSPLFSDAAFDSKIRLYPASASDVNKRVLLQGIDANTGQIIRTQDGVTYVDGEYVTLQVPFVDSIFTYAQPGPSGVQKPAKNGIVTAYTVNPDTGDETRIAQWGPSERNPDYRRSYLRSFPTSPTCCNDVTNGCNSAPVCSGIVAEAIVRLELVPASVDSDWLLIGNLSALKHGMMAVFYENQGKYDRAAIAQQFAVQDLRAELNKYAPKQTIRINALPFGTAPMTRVFAGFR